MCLHSITTLCRYTHRGKECCHVVCWLASTGVKTQQEFAHKSDAHSAKISCHHRSRRRRLVPILVNACTSTRAPQKTTCSEVHHSHTVLELLEEPAECRVCFNSQMNRLSSVQLLVNISMKFLFCFHLIGSREEKKLLGHHHHQQQLIRRKLAYNIIVTYPTFFRPPITSGEGERDSCAVHLRITTAAEEEHATNALTSAAAAEKVHPSLRHLSNSNLFQLILIYV